MENNEENQPAPQEEIVTRLYAFGSAECDQYRVSDDEDENESKRPVDLTPLLTNFRGKIHTIVCGGLHTVLLSSFGEVFTFGCNDDGALGRDGEEKIPGKVDLGIPVNMISAGDSHTVACNSEMSTVFHWGVYRNVHKGNISKSEKPHKIGESDFKNKKITKILSGAHHTMVLADEKIFAWGDSDAGILGRVPTDRRKLDQGLKIEGMGIKGVKDIFTGAYHSFLKKEFTDKDNKDLKYTSIFAWGNNNCGQLGIGHEHMFSAIPIEILEFKKKNIIQITGGEHHTIALSADGEVFAFGKNDDGQLGLGEDYVQPPSPVEGEVNKEGEIKPEEKKVDRTETKFVSRPTKVNFGEGVKITEILSGSSYNYAIVSKDDEKTVYSWGVGDNYVLGTREEDTLYEPKSIPISFFRGRLYDISLSAQHVVFTSGEEPIEKNFEVELKVRPEERKTEKKGKSGKSKDAKAEKAKEEKEDKDDKEEKEDKDDETAIEEEKPAEEEPKKSRGRRNKKAAEKEDKKEEKADEEKAGKESVTKDEKTEEKAEDKPEEKKEEKAEKKEAKKPARGRSTKKTEEKEAKEEEKVEPKETKKGRKATVEKKSEEKEAPKSTRFTRGSASTAPKAVEKKADDKKEKSKSKDKAKVPAKPKSKSPEKKKDNKKDEKKENKKDDKAGKKVHEAKKRKAESDDEEEKGPKAKKVKKTSKK